MKPTMLKNSPIGPPVKKGLPFGHLGSKYPRHLVSFALTLFFLTIFTLRRSAMATKSGSLFLFLSILCFLSSHPTCASMRYPGVTLGSPKPSRSLPVAPRSDPLCLFFPSLPGRQHSHLLPRTVSFGERIEAP
jgi:hypothetical protein